MSEQKKDKSDSGGSGSGGNGKDRIISVRRDKSGRLVVTIEGREPVVDAQIARSFPWSVPDSYISVRNAEGAEIALLDTLAELDEESREVVEAELTDKIFNPKITRVLDYTSEFGVTYITAETDRGKVTFQIRSRDDVRILSATRALFRDVDGNTYELPDINALDSASRRHVAKYF